MCGSAFDMADIERVGALEPQQLMALLKSERFERVVSSSSALSLIFPGGPGGQDGGGVLEKNLVEVCSSLHENGLVERNTFIEYCMVAADVSVFNPN